MRILGCIVTAGLVACSEPIAVDWQRALQAPSVSTPLVTDSFIAVGHELGVSLVEKDGKPRCLFKTHRDVISAPQTDGKLVFFGSTNYLFYAIDSSCTEVWRFSTGDRVKSDPLVSNGAVFVSSYDGHLYKLDAESGRELWRFPPPPPAKLNLPPPPEPKPQGKRRSKRRAPPPPQPPPPPPQPIVAGGFSYSSPVVADGIVYLGNLDHHVYAIDAARGELRGRFKTDGPVTSTPRVEEDALYFGSNDGNVYAVVTGKFDSGRVLSHDDALWTFRTQDWVNSSPRIADGVLYVGSNDRHVYAIDAISGRLRWKSGTEGPAIATPAVHENLVIAAGASGDGGIYAFQRQNGSRFWRRATGGKIESDPVVHDGALYVSSADSHLYRFIFRRTTAE